MFTALRILTLTILLVGGLSITARSSTLDSLRTEQKGDQLCVVHRVEQSETLFSLSRRYGASVDDIRAINELTDNAIDIDQVIYIPISEGGERAVAASEDTSTASEKGEGEGLHTVEPGQTLFSISQQYNLSVEELRELNDIEDNNLDIGQQLVVSSEGNDEIGKREVIEAPPKIITPVVPVGSAERPEVSREDSKMGAEELKSEEAPKEEEGPKEEHYVQPGETLRSISKKYGTKVDSLKAWNDLASSKINIGQMLIIRKEVERKDLVHRTSNYENTGYSKKWVEIDGSGVFVREEGIAGVIDGDVGTTKYLALHRKLPVGTEITILNLMNHRQIKAKVVGKLPETGLNRKVMVRLTSVSFKDLGILDPKSRVELSYASAY